MQSALDVMLMRYTNLRFIIIIIIIIIWRFAADVYPVNLTFDLEHLQFIEDVMCTASLIPLSSLFHSA